MKANILNLCLSVLSLVPIVGSTGCSVLGFSAYPIAHVMTRDTKEVLEQSPRRPNVARELSKEVQPAHYLAPGDELLLEVIDSDADVRLPADQRILADGSLDLAKYGRVVVAGMTLEQAEATIQRIISEAEGEPTLINVQLIQPIHRYYVVGEVNSPGAYPLTGHETVLDAIMEAGGLTARASACDMLLARPTDPRSCRITLPVCYRAITQLGDTSTNYHLQPGDRIFVARQSFCEEMFAYVIGPETCDRCCNCPRACRDARSSQVYGPAFVNPPVVELPPPIATEGLIETPDGPGDAAADPGVPRVRVERPEAALPEPFEDSPSDSKPRYDGELNFEEITDPGERPRVNGPETPAPSSN
jgi:protein involved in polysaccharide export with SLBB domain